MTAEHTSPAGQDVERCPAAAGRLPLSRRTYDLGLRGLLWLSAAATCALLLFLIGYILFRGLPALSWEFLTGEESVLEQTVGIFPAVVNTVYVVVVTLAIALPLGVGAAVYLTEYASSRRMVAAVEFAAEILSGIPSIIYGLVGLLIFSEALHLGKTLLAASLTLVFMNLPTIIRTTQESLKTVPQSYREGALSLGAGKWHMIATIVLPSAMDGIVTGCILSVGRVVGESAVLLAISGIGYKMNDFFPWDAGAGLLDDLSALGHGFTDAAGGTLTVALYRFAKERAMFEQAFAVAVVLLVVALAVNICAKTVGKRLKQREGDR